jgi:hypothetical protein
MKTGDDTRSVDGHRPFISRVLISISNRVSILSTIDRSSGSIIEKVDQQCRRRKRVRNDEWSEQKKHSNHGTKTAKNAAEILASYKIRDSEGSLSRVF